MCSRSCSQVSDGCRAGKHQLVVLERGPLLLVAASMLGEPIQTLSLHLELLHGQVVSILTRAFERRFQRDPGFDARTLLGLRHCQRLHVTWPISLSPTPVRALLYT